MHTKVFMTFRMAPQTGLDSRACGRLVARGRNSPPDCCSVPLVLRVHFSSEITKHHPFGWCFVIGAPNRTRTCDTIGQKHSRTTRGPQKGKPFWGEDEVRNEWVFAKGVNERCEATEDEKHFALLLVSSCSTDLLHLAPRAQVREPVNSRNASAETRWHKLKCYWETKAKTYFDTKFTRHRPFIKWLTAVKRYIQAQYWGTARPEDKNINSVQSRKSRFC